MAQAAAGTRHELELTRASLESNVERLAHRVRSELDWKTRLRRNWPQIVAIAGAVAIVGGGAVLLRKTMKRKRDGLVVEDFDRLTYRDLVKELKAMRQEIEKSREGAGGPAMKLASAAVNAAAAAAGRAAADRFADHDDEEHGTHR